MKTSNLNEHQLRAIDALQMLKGICDKNNITMYLLAGTVLGAVREHGMIPWDDDIDVGFIYSDWIKLKKILATQINDPYQYVDYDVEANFPRLQGKILHNRINCIDIFLLAKWDNKKLSGRINWFLKDWVAYSYTKKIGYIYPERADKKKSNESITSGIKSHLRQMIVRTMYFFTNPFLSVNDYLNIMKKIECFYEKRTYNCYINLYSIYGRSKETLKKEWIENPLSYVEFEGEQFTTVSDTNAYLHHLYGDYMQRPPVEERVAAHQEQF